MADGGSFSEAALKLQMSQSSVSYAIASLETELGIVLLARGRYGANLTPVGEIVERARHLKYGIALQATYQIRSDTTIVNMVAKGLGSAICPRLAAEPIPTGIKVWRC